MSWSRLPSTLHTDLQVLQVPFNSQGVSNASDARAHQGFLSAYNSVASDVIATVSSELDANPDYSLITTGHSLGGAIASIAGVSLASNIPNTPLQIFTFGQPRTGNAAYAQLAESLVGADNIFRGVHTSGVSLSWSRLASITDHTYVI